jgi:hypothetical protein
VPRDEALENEFIWMGPTPQHQLNAQRKHREMFLFCRNFKHITGGPKALDHEKPILFFKTDHFRSPVRSFVTLMALQPKRSRIPETESICVCQGFFNKTAIGVQSKFS